MGESVHASLKAISAVHVSFDGMTAESLPEIDLTVVTMQFDAIDSDGLMAVLSKYVVLARMQPGCRNIDLCASVSTDGRFLVTQKWDSPAAQRAHFDSALMIEMAQSCAGLLTAAPAIDLWDGVSAHDLA